MAFLRCSGFSGGQAVAVGFVFPDFTDAENGSGRLFKSSPRKIRTIFINIFRLSLFDFVLGFLALSVVNLTMSAG